jgi:hypothetical protein
MKSKRQFLLKIPPIKVRNSKQARNDCISKIACLLTFSTVFIKQKVNSNLKQKPTSKRQKRKQASSFTYTWICLLAF